MKARTAKRKGKAGEAEVAKLLTEWWQTLTGNDEKFLRLPTSGAWKKSKHQGDLIVPDTFVKVLPMAFEIKRDKSISIETFMQQDGAGIIHKWIKQAKNSAAQTNSDWALIFRKNNWKHWFVCVSGDHLAEMTGCCNMMLYFTHETNLYVMVRIEDYLCYLAQYFLHLQHRASQ